MTKKNTSAIEDTAPYQVPSYHIEFVRDHSIPLTTLKGREAAPEVFHRLLDKSPIEQMIVLHLNHKSELIGIEKVGMGSLGHVQTAMGEVFRGALLAAAPMIILGHNHPHGDKTPSPQDWDFTKVAISTGATLNVVVYDHFVVTPNGEHVSMWDETQLKGIRESFYVTPKPQRMRLVETLPLEYQEQAIKMIEEIPYDPYHPDLLNSDLFKVLKDKMMQMGYSLPGKLPSFLPALPTGKKW